MTFPEFRDLIKRMRLAQKNYFRERSDICLEEAKRLEKEVDEELKRPPNERELFH